MAQCHLCSEDIGRGVLSLRVKVDGHLFCQPCSELWRQQRHQRAVEEICAGQPPVKVFMIRRVWTQNPDKQGNRRLLGPLIFTDRGVCFVQIGSAQPSSLAVGLLVGVLIGALLDGDARRKSDLAFDEGENRIARPATSLVDLLTRAEGVLFHPREAIATLRIGAGGVTVKHDGRKQWYGIVKGQPRLPRELTEAYRMAIETNSDPVLACKYVSQEA